MYIPLFIAKIISHTICFSNFRLLKYIGNSLNIIIVHYKFNSLISILLIISKIHLLLFRDYVKYNIFQYAFYTISSPV